MFLPKMIKLETSSNKNSIPETHIPRREIRPEKSECVSGWGPWAQHEEHNRCTHLENEDCFEKGNLRTIGCRGLMDPCDINTRGKGIAGETVERWHGQKYIILLNSVTFRQRQENLDKLQLPFFYFCCISRVTTTFNTTRLALWWGNLSCSSSHMYIIMVGLYKPHNIYFFWLHLREPHNEDVGKKNTFLFYSLTWFRSGRHLPQFFLCPGNCVLCFSFITLKCFLHSLCKSLYLLLLRSPPHAPSPPS